MTVPASPGRRRFLVFGATLGGALLVGCGGSRGASSLGDPDLLPVEGGEVALNAWLKISPDGAVTVAVPRAEMGQGVYTSLPALVAEELGADWSRVAVEPAPVARVYGNVTVIVDSLPFADDDHGFVADTVRRIAAGAGGLLGVAVTGGSTSVRDAWEPMRFAGAAAREMLITAAASGWGVAPGECTVVQGYVRHPRSGKALSFGELASRAARLPPPGSPRLKPRSEYTLIGKPVPRLDLPDKVSGRAVFGIDVRLPRMAWAAVKQSPVFGGSVKSFDAAAVKSRRGVLDVMEVPGGVAVAADSGWRALQAVETLPVVFEDGPHAGLDSEVVAAKLKQALDSGDARSYESRGDAPGALSATGKRVEAEYSVPYLAHACMEPMNCTALVTDDRCEVWASHQAASLVRMVAAKVAGVEQEQVRVHVTLLGGGFGRRAEIDTVIQAVTVARRLKGRPVQVLWSRTEDIRHDFYRPAVACRFKAVLGADGRPQAWHHRIAGQSVSQNFAARLLPFVPESMPDKTNVEGAIHLPYDIPNLQVEHVRMELPVPVGFWRSVGHSYNAFFVESFVDELAHAAGRDPYEYRRSLYGRSPRHARLAEALAGHAGWGTPLPAGRGRGMAVHYSFHSLVGQVAEVEVSEKGDVSVQRVVCVVDCGLAVNPDIVRAQMESGIVFGLTAALHGEITLKSGGVVQSNFPDYPMVTLADCPDIEVHILESDAPLGGVGEIGTPPIAPALANAVFAATGKRIRSLPLSKHDLRRA